MRIALVTETFYPAVDSTTTTLKATADRLVDLGHTVRIVAPGPGLASYRGCDVVRVRPLEPTAPRSARPSTSSRPTWCSVLTAVRRPQGPQARAPRRAHAGRRAVTDPRPGRRLLARQGRRPGRPRAGHRAVDGRPGARSRRRRGLWRPGVDTHAFTPDAARPVAARRLVAGPLEGGPQVVVGYVGGLHKRHGVRRLAELADVPGIRPVIIGDGPERELAGVTDCPAPGSPARSAPAT